MNAIGTADRHPTKAGVQACLWQGTEGERLNTRASPATDRRWRNPGAACSKMTGCAMQHRFRQFFQRFEESSGAGHLMVWVFRQQACGRSPPGGIR